MLPIVAAFLIVWYIVHRLLDRGTVKTGVIIESEREGPKSVPWVLVHLQWWAGLIGLVGLTFWGWVAFDRAGAQNMALVPTLWKIAWAGDAISRAVATGVGSAVLSFALFIFTADRREPLQSAVMFAGVQLFGEKHPRAFVFKEPERGDWPRNFASEMQKEGTLIAWRGHQIVLLLRPLHEKKHLSFGVTDEMAGSFLAELMGNPDSPFDKAVLDYRALLEYDLQKAKAEQLALAESLRQQELARQRALEADHRKKEAERKELQQHVMQAYEENWSYPPAGLLMGTVRAHPLDGYDVSIPKHLNDEYDSHFYDLPVWFTGEEMGLTFGNTGSGKFTAAIASNVLLFDGSCFVIDPKGEICAVTAEARKNQRGQNVYRLDPFNITRFASGVDPAPLASYNPLDALLPDALDFADDARSLAEVIVEPPTGDTYWADEAKTLLTALIMFVRVHPDAKGVRNLSKVHEYLNPEPGKLEWLFQEMSVSAPAADYETIRLCGYAHRGLPDKQREGIWAAARKELALFSLPSIKNVTSSSTFNFEELLEGGCTLYLVLDAQRLKSHNRWLRLIMTVSLMMAVRHQGRGKPMLWIVDEAAQLGQNDIIPEAYRLLRGYNVRMWTFWQDLVSIKKTFPHDWGSLVSNSFVQVLSSGDYDTSKYFCDLAGEHEVEKRSVGETHGSSLTRGISGSGGYSSGSSNSFGSGGGSSSTNSGYNYSSGTSESSSTSFSSNTNLSWQWEPRVRVNDLQTMGEDRMYIRFPKKEAAFFTKYHYFKAEDLLALASPNPFFKGQTVSQARRRKTLQRNFNQLLGSPSSEELGITPVEHPSLVQRVKKFQPLEED